MQGSRILGVVALLLVGASIGRCSADDPVTEIRTIKVPVVKTHIEYRDKVLPPPVSCTDAYAALPRIIEGDRLQSRAAGNILLDTEDLSTAVAFTEVSEVNHLVTEIRRNREVISQVLDERASAMSTFKANLRQCQIDVGD